MTEPGCVRNAMPWPTGRHRGETGPAPPSARSSTIGRGIYFGHFRLKKLRLHRSAAKKSRQRLWHDDAASARFQPSSGRGRRSRWRAPPRSVGEFVCSWGHHSGRHALALLRCDGSAATKTSRRCEPSRRAHPPPALEHPWGIRLGLGLGRPGLGRHGRGCRR